LLKPKRGRKHPLGHFTRPGEHEPYQFGFELVLLIASGDRFRIPVAVGLLEPPCRGHQHSLFRQMLKTVVPPAWVRQVVVVADAGFAANATLRLITEQHYAYGFAMPRTRKFTDGKYVRDLVQHLPQRCYYRRASTKPDGRRQDYWVFARRATLHNLGDVTIVLSKKRRNDGPKGVKILGTNLTQVSAGAICSIYARRWGIELTIKELQSGLHLGPMQVTTEAERVARSVALPVVAYLLRIRLYGHEALLAPERSLFKLKERFIEDVVQEPVSRTELKWQRKLKPLKRVA
jgi:Transposase DDE domain